MVAVVGALGTATQNIRTLALAVLAICHALCVAINQQQPVAMGAAMAVNGVYRRNAMAASQERMRVVQLTYNGLVHV